MPEAALDWRSGQRCSQDLRDRGLAAMPGGMPVGEAAAIFKVSNAHV